MVGNLLLKTQPSEPTAGQMPTHLFEPAALAGNPIEVTYQQQGPPSTSGSIDGRPVTL